jgi:hypothetical protein
MSLNKNTPVELSDIVKEANLILEVRYVEAFMEEIAIKTADPKIAAPPFKKKGFVFSVTNILKNPDKVNVPKTIRVPAEEWRRSLSQHKESHADGLSKSFEIKQFETSVNSMKAADILFLHHFQGTFELVAKGSFESTEALEKITILIEDK